MQSILRAGCLIVPAIASLIFLIESGLGGEYYKGFKNVLIQDVIPKGNGKLEKASPGILVDGHILYCSGQIGTFPRNDSLPEGFDAQADNALANIWYCLQNDVSNKTIKCEYDDVVLLTVFLLDLENLPKFLEMLPNYYKPPYPTKTVAQATKLPRNAEIEIAAVAYCGKVIRRGSGPDYGSASASEEY